MTASKWRASAIRWPRLQNKGRHKHVIKVRKLFALAVWEILNQWLPPLLIYFDIAPSVWNKTHSTIIFVINSIWNGSDSLYSLYKIKIDFVRCENTQYIYLWGKKTVQPMTIFYISNLLYLMYPTKCDVSKLNFTFLQWHFIQSLQ